MTPAALLIALALLSVGAFWIGKSRSLALVGGTAAFAISIRCPAITGS